MTLPITYTSLERSIRNNDLSAAVRINLVTALALYFFNDDAVLPEFADIDMKTFKALYPNEKDVGYMQHDYARMLHFRRTVMIFVRNFVDEYLIDHTADDTEVLHMLLYVVSKGWGVAYGKVVAAAISSIKPELLSLAHFLLEGYDPNLATIGQTIFMELFKATTHDCHRQEMVEGLISNLRLRLGNAEYADYAADLQQPAIDDIPF